MRLVSLLVCFAIGVSITLGSHAIRNLLVQRKETSPRISRTPSSTPQTKPAAKDDEGEQRLIITRTLCRDTGERPAHFFVDEEQLSLNGYTIEKRLRKERTDFFEEPSDTRNWVDISYVVVKKGKRVMAKFDAGLAHPLGNGANFGLFPFLGKKSPQVFISEDVPRGGCQWIVSLTPAFRVIFDGQAFGVGREATDLVAVDLDEDGVYEVIAPITDFYQLQDKLYIAAIPLPDIIFKYEPARQKYVPANELFKDRAAVLSNLLIHIYAGEEKQGWEFYERNYKLSDKAEIKRRVNAILSDQPVYKFIYYRGKT
jgi:hypothetical protein